MMNTYNNKLAHSELLDGIKEYLQFKFGHHDNSVTSPCPDMRDDDEAVYVTEREETHYSLGCNALFLSGN